MPILKGSASDFTSTVKGSAEVNAAVGGAVARGGNANPPRAAGAVAAVVTQSAIAKTSGLQPTRFRVIASTPTPVLSIIIGNATLGVDYTITTNGTRTFYNFLATGKTMTVTTNIPVVVDYLALGGGGGGGYDRGAGGGAGGLQQATGYTLPAGTYNVVIGAGGDGGTSYINGPKNGGSTLFGSIVTAVGGGGGGTPGFIGPSNGGCGGGGCQSFLTGGTGTQGFNGGNGVTFPGSAAGGGGGVGGHGKNATTGNGGDGGIGIIYNNGSSLQLGGGGGGSYDFGSGPVRQGVGVYGGGNAGVSGGSPGGNGTRNTGGGGGGGANGPPAIGGTGGSGIFILSYAS